MCIRDRLDIIQYIRKNTKFKLVNTIIWYYKNGMSAHRFFANRHEEAIWLVKSNDYYFDLDSVRVPYSEEDLKVALRDKRLNPETTRKGKNPTNVWEIGRLNGNSKEQMCIRDSVLPVLFAIAAFQFAIPLLSDLSDFWNCFLYSSKFSYHHQLSKDEVPYD